MDNFILIAFCMAAGMFFKARRWIPPDAHKSINVWVLYVALPAASLRYIPEIEWSAQMLLPVASSMIVWMGSWIFMEAYCRYKGYSQRSRSSLELASGYSNTSFVGFPLVVAYLGEQSLSIAVICDQSMFILFSIAGVIAAVKGGGAKEGTVSTAMVLRRLVSFPPFIACVLALVLSPFIDLSPTAPFFEKLALTVSPLALFSVGLQLKFKGWRQQVPQISMALFYKLLVAPALVLGVVVAIGMKGAIPAVSVLEASMPALVTSGIVAEQYRLNSRLVNLIIGVSIIVGFLTTAFWNGVLHWLAIV